MMAGLRMRELVILASALAAGLMGAAVAIGGRGTDSEFLYRQQHPQPVPPAEVERVVRTAPDPTTGKGAGVAASCLPRGRSLLRNPWTCVVRYRSGRRVRLAVRVRDDGSYFGRYAGGGAVRGCCIETATR